MILELDVKFRLDGQTYTLVVTRAGATRLDRVTASNGLKAVPVASLDGTPLGERVRGIVTDTRALFAVST